MRKLGFAATGFVLLALILGGASRANAATLSKGTVELVPTLNFSRSSYSFQNSDAGSITTLVGSGRLGYCLSDRVEVDGGLLINHLSVDDPGTGSENATSFGLTGGVTLNFATSGNTVPFLRLGLGVLSNSGELTGDETTFLAPVLEGGLRLMIGSASSVNFGVFYQHESDALGQNDLSANTLGLLIGVSVFPRR